MEGGSTPPEKGNFLRRSNEFVQAGIHPVFRRDYKATSEGHSLKASSISRFATRDDGYVYRAQPV